MSQPITPAIKKEELAADRERLVRLCGRITGDATAAEDLAQETLFEAWRNADNLRDVEQREAWLTGIARNVCRRWARRRGLERSRIVPSGSESASNPADWLANDLDLELELERDELAILLDRALALLPAETRLALVQRYIEDAPQALVAEQLGLSEGAVAMRLSRGKLSLRRILAGELRDEAVALGLFPAATPAWKPTRVWCPVCGVERLNGWFDPVDGTLMLRCPGCFPKYGLLQVRSRQQPYVYAGVQGVKAANRRMLVFCHDYYQRALAENHAECQGCGGTATVHRCLPENELPRIRGWRGVHTHCTVCDATFHTSLDGLIISLPAARTFWRHHGQIRTISELEIEFAGRPAIVSRFESVTSSAFLEVITDITSLATRGVFVNGVPQPSA